jgi:hypothetical protein
MMSQDAEERKITQQEYEQLCLESCDWVTPAAAVNLDEDVLWCRICTRLFRHFEKLYIQMNREISAGEDCKEQIQAIVQSRRSAPFDRDARDIAREYIDDALSKADILKEK